MPKRNSYEAGRARQLGSTIALLEVEQRTALEQINHHGDSDPRAARDHMMRWLALDDLRLDLNA